MICHTLVISKNDLQVVLNFTSNNSKPCDVLDRFDRRQVILVDNLLRGVVVALVPLLYAWGQLALWHVYAVAAIYGGTSPSTAGCEI